MLGDILDGYFPYDLKGRYPEGIPFKIVDHTEDLYDPKAYEPTGNMREMLKIDEQFRPLTKEEFLKQLPEKVIKQGKIVPIREEVGKRLGVQPETATVQADTQAIEVATHVTLAEKAGKAYKSEDVTHIRLRTQSAAHYLLLRLLTTDTMATVYKYSAKYR